MAPAVARLLAGAPAAQDRFQTESRARGRPQARAHRADGGDRPEGHAVQLINATLNDTLLIVDPSPVDRQRLAAELRAAGTVRVLTAPFLAEMSPSDSPPPLGLVLAPRPEEVTPMLERARDLFGQTSTVVIGYLPAVAAFAAARLGASAFLPKPVSGLQLLAVLRSRDGHQDPTPLPSLARAEWEYLHSVLDLCQGNRSETARRLGIHRSVLQRKLGRLPPSR
jgi:two-component system response regulator RegA